MKQYKYFRLKLSNFPGNVIEQYDLKHKCTPKGYIHIEVRKCMYVIPQAGLLAQEILEECLATKGYT